jgi:hypothetical protein
LQVNVHLGLCSGTLKDACTLLSFAVPHPSANRYNWECFWRERSKPPLTKLNPKLKTENPRLKIVDALILSKKANHS